ncbi:hypothetical protein PGT21_037187 [Puccinia graminis f. sp. tritici]|uniref:Uncharacterized protein n=1 Tax=Puccinia graminis f. sp. tritici TaxID=56615 RepID=A0A5B0R3J3_PUCGR|nr:hypothetical protein PGT21_037187 [Puccinia graminis f. sp. tritici]
MHRFQFQERNQRRIFRERISNAIFRERMSPGHPLLPSSRRDLFVRHPNKGFCRCKLALTNLARSGFIELRPVTLITFYRPSQPLQAQSKHSNCSGDILTCRRFNRKKQFPRPRKTPSPLKIPSFSLVGRLHLARRLIRIVWKRSHSQRVRKTIGEAPIQILARNVWGF